jgi:Zn-dependent M28 family amino/carboxypeptidase
MGRDEKTLGLFNLEMIGWSKTDVSKKPTVKLYTRVSTESGAEKDIKLAKLFDTSAKGAKVKLKPVILPNGFNRSDNWSFWQNGLPSVCITEDWESDFNESNYHTDHDDIKNLNLKYLTEITNATIYTVREALKASSLRL